MLPRRMFFTVLILFSLILAPGGIVRAYPKASTNNYEPDNTPGQAKLITSGTPQTRSIAPQTDVDWIKFQLTGTSGVLLETTGSLSGDTRISLFNGSLAPIEYNDDDGFDFFSFIHRECGTDPLPAGTYYVKVEEYLNNAQIPTYHLAFDSSPCPAETIDIYAGGIRQGSSLLTLHGGTRRSLPGVNNGPVKIMSLGTSPLIAAERVIYRVNGVNTSFSEIMAMPDGQLDVSYWMPWYNNVDLDTQLRIANVTASPATVTVTIGSVVMPSFNLAAGASVRKSYAGVNHGPVRITSSQNIVAAERVIYKVNGVNTSFTEMMGLPGAKLDTTYWLPWYNNVDLDTQLRIANIAGAPAAVRVYIGGAEMQGSPISLGAGASTRLSFPGINNGPVRIVSDQFIVAAERVIYRVNGVNTSFAEMMALPNSQLNTSYWLPWYNNSGDLDTQLRIANVGASTATVHIYIGGVEMTGSPFNLLSMVSTRKSFPGVNNGPVQILSDQPIVAAERLIYKVNGVNTSFTEMMALPGSQLDLIHWLPWYNNVDLDSQLRFGLP
ncbi:MAG TPA: DVUA0089 family protein [Anaerolineales bacterium]|nr:DVUA0089 family protein [Anaerolineales bacterium]